MQLIDLLKKMFLTPTPTDPEDLSGEDALNIRFKIVVVEFAESVENNAGELISTFLGNCEGLDVTYFDQPFDKGFLDLSSRTFFDLIDKGQRILDRSGADVLIWGRREDNKIRLNFQTSLQYETSGDSFVSLLDSLYFPAELFNNSQSPFPPSLINLLYGATVAALNLNDKSKKIQKRYLLKKIIAKLSSDNSAKAISLNYIPYIMKFLGLIYLSYCANSNSDKNFKIVENLFETALKHQDLINNPIHLGCIYYHYAQLFDASSEHLPKRPINSYKNAINNYRLAQKYLGKYQFPYEYGLISFRLSNLYYNYWRQKEDLQALRDSVFNLRESEKIFTYALFPEFWSQIEGRLGYLLSLLSNITASDEIAELAIASYKNQQKIITEKRDPLLWAQIQEKIGEIYYRIGKKGSDKDALEEALEYFHDSLYIFENMNREEECKRLTTAIAKTSQVISYQ